MEKSCLADTWQTGQETSPALLLGVGSGLGPHLVQKQIPAAWNQPPSSPQEAQSLLYFGAVPFIHTAHPLPESTSWFQTVSGKLGFRATYNHKPGPEGEHWVGGLWTWTCGLHGGCSQTQRTFIQSKWMNLEMTPPAPSLSSFPTSHRQPPPPTLSESWDLSPSMTTSTLIPSKTTSPVSDCLYHMQLRSCLLVICSSGSLPVSVILVFIHLFIPSQAALEHLHHHQPQAPASQHLAKRIRPNEWPARQGPLEGEGWSTPSHLQSAHGLKKVT